MIENRKTLRYCVIGAGHGGQALAAYLQYLGNSTVLYNRTKIVVDEINALGGIELYGMINAMVKGMVATSDLSLALDSADLILVCIPAHAHQDIATRMAPFLKPHHKIVIHPGRTLGAYMFERYLKEAGLTFQLPIGETDTFALTSRKIRPGLSHVYSRKKQLKIAALSPEFTDAIYNDMRHSFSMLVACTSPVETSLSNIGAIFHPIGALLNIGRIESGEAYLHYKQGISPTIARFLEKLDAERIELGEFFGFQLHTAYQWLDDVYGSQGNNLFDALQNTRQYDEIFSPNEITTRYVYEDIPTGIVPMVHLAKLAQTKHSYLQLTLDLANALYGIDFNDIGRWDVEDFFNRYRPKG
ncbi:MAG: NADP transhydrogenase subunit alpha [Firmicutes bacterium HGW-Firmicutes-10]|jgi:opine dehydrogenase|nr:MAG: NADP transhydrogenase subunit alpha [Firmicutes bacterium HGW-Firmicutes-10]